MRTIAIFNLKGGVGKTITTATMAYCLANRHRKRVLVTQWRNTELEREMLRRLPDFGLPVFDRVIRMSEPVPYALSAGENLLVYSPTCAASVDYKRAVQEYLDKLGGGERDA